MTTQRDGKRSVKTTIVLPEEDVAILRELAADRNVSLAEAVRRALTVDKYLRDARREGCRILVQDAEKALKEIVII